MIERLEFASCYVYSPRGKASVSVRSRLLRDLLKAGDANALPKYAWRVHEQLVKHGEFPGFFDRDAVLVPVPGSAPRVKDALWVPERLALAFKQEGLAKTVWTGLGRVSAVDKSATAPAGARPSVQEHYDSFAVEGTLAAPEKIILVDDVITKGRTLLAAATRLVEAFPGVQLQAFALVRTMGLVPDIEQ